MSRQLRVLAWLVCGLLLTSGGMASAHVLKEDNGISALLHIEPDDDPVAGQPTRLKIDFGDSNDSFSLANCDCQVALEVNDRTIIQTAKLTPGPGGETLDTEATVTFPKVGSYDVLLNGHATNSSFPDFHLDYDVNVTTANPKAQGASSQAVLLLSGAVLIVIAPLLFVFLRWRSR